MFVFAQKAKTQMLWQKKTVNSVWSWVQHNKIPIPISAKWESKFDCYKQFNPVSQNAQDDGFFWKHRQFPALPCGFCRRLHSVGLWQRSTAQLLTQTFVGRIPSGPGPGSVLVKGVTSLAVGSRGVMLAGTDQATVFPFNTLTGVTVTLTSKGNIDR